MIAWLAVACTFDGSGSGRASGSLDDGADEAGGTDDLSGTATHDGSPSPGDDAGDTDGAGPPNDDDGAAPSSASDGEGSTGGAVDDAGGHHDADADGTGTSGAGVTCPMEMTELLWVDQAELEDPMHLSSDPAAHGDPSVAVSSIPGKGVVTFSFDLPCPGEYHVWGLVWDYWPGAYATNDPDSFDFGLGASDGYTWRYGCQTAGEASGLSWQPLAALTQQPCTTSRVVIEASEAGPVALAFRNREAGAGSVVAGIAAIVVSTDPDVNPYSLYAPY